MDKWVIREYIKNYGRYNENYIYDKSTLQKITKSKPILIDNKFNFQLCRLVVNKEIKKQKNIELLETKMKLNKNSQLQITLNKNIYNFLEGINKLKLCTQNYDPYTTKTQYKKLMKSKIIENENNEFIEKIVPYLEIKMHTSLKKIVESIDYVIME